jgi:hypothetical protein
VVASPCSQAETNESAGASPIGPSAVTTPSTDDSSSIVTVNSGAPDITLTTNTSSAQCTPVIPASTLTTVIPTGGTLGSSTTYTAETLSGGSGRFDLQYVGLFAMGLFFL